MLVLTGAILNVIAAVITNSLIDDHNKEIAALANQQSHARRRIDSTWERIQDSERKRDSLMILELLGGDDPDIDQYVKRELALCPLVADDSGLDIVQAIKEHQLILRDDLDERHFGTLDCVQEQVDELAANMS